VAWHYLFEERYDDLPVMLFRGGSCLPWPQSKQIWMGRTEEKKLLKAADT
jgi:hypothetical protein